MTNEEAIAELKQLILLREGVIEAREGVIEALEHAIRTLILMQVEHGLKTVRQASVELDWDMEKVQEVLWGEVRL